MYAISPFQFLSVEWFQFAIAAFVVVVGAAGMELAELKSFT